MPQPYSDVEALIAAHPVLRNAVIMCGKGWFPIIARFAQAAAALPTKAPLRVDLIKSKYGELSMFLAGGDGAEGDPPGARRTGTARRGGKRPDLRTVRGAGPPDRSQRLDPRRLRGLPADPVAPPPRAAVA